MRAISRAEVDKPRESIHPTTGMRYLISDFFGDHTARGEGPQGFLVEFPNPGGHIRPHFHDVNQFQVVVEGNCRVGTHPAASVAVHYADAYTTYGPIVAGDQGFSFFTLRAESTRGSNYMPESKHLLTRKRGRELAYHISEGKTDGANGDACAVTPLIAQEVDGLTAALIALAPGAKGWGCSPRDGAGQYYLVVSGSLLHNRKELGRLSLLFLSPEDNAPELSASGEGATVLCMQLPRQAA